MEKTCSSCGMILDITKFSKNKQHKDGYEYSCKKCKSIYQKKHFSNTEKREKKLRQGNTWRNINRSHKRKKDLEYVHKKLFTGRMLGTSNICQHIRKTYDGTYDFDKEYDIINKEHNFLLKKGNKWFICGRMGVKPYKQFEENLYPCDTYDICIIDPRNFELKCPLCKHNEFEYCRYPPKYTDDGFIVEYCNNCGNIINW